MHEMIYLRNSFDASTAVIGKVWADENVENVILVCKKCVCIDRIFAKVRREA
jgi:hypothetical protein